MTAFDTFEHYSYEDMLAYNKAGRELILKILKPEKKYTLIKIQKKLRKCGIDWKIQRIAVYCHRLCDDEQLKYIRKRNKNFYFKPLDNEAEM